MFTVESMKHFSAPWLNFGEGGKDVKKGAASRKKEADGCAGEKERELIQYVSIFEDCCTKGC